MLGSNWLQAPRRVPVGVVEVCGANVGAAGEVVLAATVALGPVGRKAVSMTKFGLRAAVTAASWCCVHATLQAMSTLTAQLACAASPRLQSVPVAGTI